MFLRFKFQINNIPALVQITDTKPLFAPMMVSLLMHMCVYIYIYIYIYVYASPSLNELTHCPLGDLNEILDYQFSIRF